MDPISDLSLHEAADVVRAAGVEAVDFAVVAGSGFSGLASRLESPIEIPYDRLPGVPTGHVLGHAGRLLVGQVVGKTVALFDGRAHMYQGFTARDAAFTARLAAPLGASVIVLTNAAGGVNPDLQVGELLLISDSINLTARTPLEGWTPAEGTPFVPMCEVWDPDLRELVQAAAAAQLGDPLREAIYAQLTGPQYETPAEVAMLHTIGADVVGMSTVMEAIAARALGLRVLGISLVTNMAGCSDLHHEDIVAEGERASVRAGDLLVGILQGL